MKFTLLKTDTQTRARLARMELPHGDWMPDSKSFGGNEERSAYDGSRPCGLVETPVFMPVGTQGSLKGCLPDAVADMGVQIILANTYHLLLRPTTERLEKLGGLHRLMGWNRPILTDSGGFQVFSLAKLAKIDADGVSFQSHLDGAQMRLTPESVMEAQRQIGSDIAMVLDVCPDGKDATHEAVASAVDSTISWAARAAAVCASNKRPHNVFGIVQGGVFEEERERCAKALVAMNFDGYAIGGVAVGEEVSKVLAQTAFTAPMLPADKPRYAMGIGNPVQILEMVAQGVDMFDCVIPTREARHGVAYTTHGKINLKNEQWKDDLRPLDEAVVSPASKFSRAYIRHLIVSDELLGLILLSYHNIAFFNSMMAEARAALREGNFAAWKAAWVARYERGRE